MASEPYVEIRARRLRAVKLGRKTLILRADACRLWGRRAAGAASVASEAGVSVASTAA
jgi:hypothetical protein